MYRASYIVATNFLVTDQLLAAAVIYPREVEEPTFSYTVNRRNQTAYLFRRGDKVPASLASALNDYIRKSAVSWALISAHPRVPPETALTLAIIRAVERWVCRTNKLPLLNETCVLLPTKKELADLPSHLRQVTNTKDWRTAAARALCRYRATNQSYEAL